MDWLNQLERRMRPLTVVNLMYWISGIMLVVYVVDLFFGGGLSRLMWFSRDAILQGQIWRVLTFVFIPPNAQPIWILFSLYFYCLLGNALEREYGSTRFTMFYLCGVLLSVFAGFLTGAGTTEYLNLSLFLAFAFLYPDFQLLVFFVIPIKVKYLALLDVLLLVWQLVIGGAYVRLAIVFAVLNVLIFFYGNFIRNIRQQIGFWKTRSQFRKYNRR